MTRKTLLTLAVLTALSAGTAFAATQSDGTTAAKPQRASLDANSDGSIDRAEAAKSPRLSEKFDQLDKNKDGQLAKEEMPRRHGSGKSGHGPREMMSEFDADKDGRISRAEASAGEGKLASRFDRMDANKDGFIDRTDRELRARQRTDEWFARADTDKDGKLTRDEVDAAGSQRMEHRGPRAPKSASGKPAD